MQLSDDQLYALIQLVTPQFLTVQDRQAVLSQIKSSGSVLLQLPDIDESPEHFTASLVTELAQNQARTRSGELALVQLLLSLQEASMDGAFSRSLQRYINVLRAPDESRGNG